MVVDACFIASQIDVWTQAYNGPTSRRKYVLNLLNVLHKNVTEEYKTDQFLHVIYWFLIYKSNLGHFFRNEGIFPPPPPPLLPPTTPRIDLARWSGACRRCPLRNVRARPRVCLPLAQLLQACPRSTGKLQVSGGRDGVVLASSVWLTPFETENRRGGLLRGPHGHVITLGSCTPGLLFKWPLFSGSHTGFMTD